MQFFFSLPRHLQLFFHIKFCQDGFVLVSDLIVNGATESGGLDKTSKILQSNLEGSSEIVVALTSPSATISMEKW